MVRMVVPIEEKLDRLRRRREQLGRVLRELERYVRLLDGDPAAAEVQALASRCKEAA